MHLALHLKIPKRATIGMQKSTFLLIHLSCCYTYFSKLRKFLQKYLMQEKTIVSTPGHMSQCKPEEMTFQHSVSGVISFPWFLVFVDLLFHQVFW